ncbi:AsmA family protein [Cohaesibacter haloalkalitolerans]|uniref:AsmA family protein n=1 Tax=Cohaesibacter haloalkalitolerans TaxID=1162980 RepID=UPI000E652C63|nr:AsmA family protein [Cohaesibacter haloalkalitolerans]
MRNIIISIVSAVILIVMALLLIPAFLSTDYLKAQVVTLVKDQTGMTLAIDGDVSLSFITGIKLTTESVSLKDQQDKPLFSVRQLDFGLALSPLMKGKADITGITLDKPVITIAKGATAETTATGNQAATPAAPGSAAATPVAEATSEALDLSALSLRGLTINDAQIVTIDEGGHTTELMSGLNATVRIPDFNGSAEIEATLPYNDRSLSITGSLANAGRAINGQSSALDLSIDGDLIKVKAVGELALKGTQLFTANYAANIGNVTQFMDWIGANGSMLDVKTASIEGSVIALNNEIRLPSLSLTLDKQQVKAAARIFTASTKGNPLIRVAVDSSTLNFDELLNTAKSGAKSGAKSETGAKGTATQPDLSLLQDFDATLDFRAGRLTYQGQSLRQVKLLTQLANGKLTVDLKSANLAKGNVQAILNGDLGKLVWSGSLTARELDVGEMASLAGQKSPMSGMISASINFAAQGLSAEEIAKKGNLAGTVTLQKGQYSNPALEAAIPNRPTGTISNLSSQIKIANLDDPVDISGAFSWNGDTIRYSSRIGLGELIANAPVAASLSLQAKELSLALAGRLNPAKLSLSGSKLTIKTGSSKRLLAWLGQPVTNGTPDLPVLLSGQMDLGTDRTTLKNLSLEMGQTKGTGTLDYVAGTIPSISGSFAFDRLDVTPFMGNGQEQGRGGNGQASRPAAQTGWDTSPIDFSGLNTIKADLAFSAKSLVARDITMGPVGLTAKVAGGQLTTTLSQMALYNGKGNGQVSVDARTKPAKLAAKFALSGLNMKPFLADTIGMRALSGKGGVTIDLTAQGASQAQIIKQLNGTSAIEIKDGQINGINIPQMLRSLQGNILEGWASSDAQSTDFSALTASFTFQNGIASNNDLSMLSPLFRLSGAGTIDLPNMTINYKTTPKVIAKLKGQGGPVNADGVPIPIIIKGKLTKPRIYPDIAGILENPQAILKSLEQMGGAGKDASKAIQKIEKNVTKELQKQSDKLGVDLNQLLAPQGNNQQQNNNNGTKPKLEQQLLQGITKGLFGN